jgi:hypothetical protein
MIIGTGYEGRDLNQIKFANRQLYDKTAGLEIQLNCIIFDSTKPRASTLQFFQFVKGCTPNRLKWLRSVIIDEKKVDDGYGMTDWLNRNMKTILRLLKLCNSNKHLLIHLRIPGWTATPLRSMISTLTNLS